MRSKVGLIVLQLSLATLGVCQDRVTLTFPTDSDREAWIAKSLPQEAPKDSVITSKSQVDLKTTGFPDYSLALVWEKSTGNLASRTLGDVKRDGTWVLKPESFKDIASVHVLVQYSGKAVAAGEVTLTDGRRTMSQLLDPAMNGDVSFFGIKPGQVKVTVKYRTKGAMASPVTQIVQLDLSRSEAVPKVVVAVPSETSTVGGSSAEAVQTAPKGEAPKSEATAEGKASTKTDREPASQPANPIGSFIVTLLGLGVAGAGIYYALQYAKKNPALVQGKLEQMGVQVPKPGDDEPIVTAAPAAMPAAKPAPQPKIILDDAGVDPISMPVASTTVSEPRLVSDTGDAMLLPEGETVVGREVGLGLTLVEETTVSRRHAELTRMGQSVTVKDLGSTNGTSVNGRPIAMVTPLRNGDYVQFGSVRFRFEG